MFCGSMEYGMEWVQVMIQYLVLLKSYFEGNKVKLSSSEAKIKYKHNYFLFCRGVR